MSLFEDKKISVPLADRIRPETLEEFIGQDELVGPGTSLRKAIEEGEIQSMIFWGPPGTGKTTLARIIGRSKGVIATTESLHSINKYRFVNFSAVLSGVKEVRQVVQEAKFYNTQGKQASLVRTILFIDEIHRFNKAQQDSFLPYVEDGTIILIGSTTENPSFEIIAPLLSRVNVYVFKPLSETDVIRIINRALELKEGLLCIEIKEEVKKYIAQLSCGDARVALNILEFAANVQRGKGEERRGMREERGEKREERGERREDRGEKREGRREKIEERGEKRDERREKGEERRGMREERGERREERRGMREERGEKRDERGEKREERREKRDERREKGEERIRITILDIKRVIKERPLLYDKKGEEHYNLISAFIKSMRGSDADASVYWLARMVESGEDPLFIVRRMVIFAAEDIGNADPQALVVASSCKSAIELAGMPEGFLPLSQTAIYLAKAPKSNTVLTAYKNAMEDVKKYGALPVPLHLRNPGTKYLNKKEKYPYLPEKLKGKRYLKMQN